MTHVDHLLDSSIKQFDDNIRNFLSRDGWAHLSKTEDLLKIYKHNCFYYTDNQSVNDTINQRLTEFAKAFIAGEDGDFDQYKAKLKSYDFSATCGLVWTTNYFAYRCRTCCLSPSMSLCGACFNNGNHIGHDFNKFKSQAGGACDCGNSYVMKEFGYCRHHGPSKLSQQRDPPENLTMRLKLLLPIYLQCALFGCWALIQNIDMDDSSLNISSSGTNTSDILIPILAFINELLTCGWVAQKIIAGIMIDKLIFKKFITESKDTDQFYVYESASKTDPQFKFPEGKVDSQQLHHHCLVDAFMFVCVKLRFPENLITFLIGLLTMDSYKDIFVHSYLNHYSRMASTILIHAKTVRNGQDASYNMNNRIVHISVQLFSGEVLALKMVKERNLHYLIVHCLLNMFNTALTRLDSNENYVINCETPMIQNNVFWPLISDLTNLVTHKSVVEYFLSDLQFMGDWTKLLKLMQFMNFFVLKEGNHIEYETMAFFHAYTMEIEISANSMWNLWYHYRGEEDKESALKLVQIFVSALAEFMENLGTFQTILVPHESRSPLSFHLPLMRNVACFTSLGLVYHHLPLSRLLENINTNQMIRWFEETCNTLLGCQEVLIGYWVRNGQSVRTSTTYYIHSQFCYALIDMDIIAAQICASVIPSSTVLEILTNSSQLLKGIKFTLECKNPYENQNEMAINSKKNANGFEKIGIEKQPLALEAWLMNLCWILDLRNEMSLDDVEKLRKEVCCELCPEPIKRSDLSHRLPERTGINIQISPDVDAILNKVANYTAPTFDEYSGNLQSGLYTFKPELWDTDYDPIFQSLRSVTKRDAADALAKYREYYRVKEGITQSNSLWPPYRKPPPPHPQLIRMENVLHCKDMSYILFCCLNMYVNNDSVVTEDSLALVIHLIHRSLIISESQNELDEDYRFHRTRFPTNQYKVNDAWSNLRYKIELSCEIKKKEFLNFTSVESESNQMDTESIENKSEFQVIQRESILSLLLKVHSKLHTTRLHTGGKSLLVAKSSKLQKIHPISSDPVEEPMEVDEQIDMRVTMSEGKLSSYNNSGNRQGYLLDVKAFEFFNTYPLAYQYYPDNLQKAIETGIGINWGDGVDFVGHLLDIIISKDDENSKALLELMQNIQECSGDKATSLSIDQSDSKPVKIKLSENKGEGNLGLIDSVLEKKQKAQDRRRRVIASMAQKQKAFANAHQLDFVTKEAPHKEENEMYECVICQLKSNPNIDKMVLLGIVCSAGLLKYMQNQTESSNLEKKIIYRKDYIQNLFFSCPVLTHGMIIQTCGHVVHQDCFDKYKAQRPAVTRMRRTITCPLCRRDVHHLTPIHVAEHKNSLTDSFYDYIKEVLFQSINIPIATIQLNIIEESISKNQASIISSDYQSCSLLRSQLELELIICLSHPDQYNSVIRRCIWPEFISYLRILNGNIRTVIKQTDFLFKCTFRNEIIKEEDENLIYNFLFDSPVDVLLNFIPYIWPYEEYFYIVLKGCISMAYVKAIISLSTRFDSVEFNFHSQKPPPKNLFHDIFRQFSNHCQVSTVKDSFNYHLSLILNKIVQHISHISNEELYSPHIHTLDSIIVHILQFMLPLLRIACIIKLRWAKITQISSDFPISIVDVNETRDYYKELENMCLYLNLPISPEIDKNPLDRIVGLINECLLVTNYQNIDHFVDAIVTDAFVDSYFKEKSSLVSTSENSLDILNVGNELFPPKLKSLPHSYDDLFNVYHSEKCANTNKAPPHNFPENGLCLICGKLICLICDSMPLAFNEHTKSCCYGIGLIIDVNTSIIHVLLNNEISQWGSVYLDFYGEEDLELKRGRPLFINSRRFSLLEQQWLSHSFKHVVKSWRRVS